MRRLLGALLACLPLAALASESETLRSPRASATLIADQAAVAPGGTVMLGLRLRLAPGWHTYWRNAGDAGAPPEITLTLPEGATAGPIAWPAPERIPYGPLVNFGYHGDVLLPLPVRLPDSLPAGGTIPIEAAATWLVCEQVCIPEEGRFRLDLPVEAEARTNPATARQFAAAAAALPRPAPWQAAATLGPAGGALVLDGAGLSRATVREAVFLPAEGGLLDNAAPQRLTLARDRLTLSLTPASPAPARPATLEGVLLLTDQGGARI